MFNPLIDNIIISIISLAVVTISAGYIIQALAHYAKQTGVSDYFIGFFVLAMGTSLPEFTSAIVASIKGVNTLVLGNLIGASILDATIVLGLTSLIGKRLFVRGKLIDKTILSVIVMALLPLTLGVDGHFSRFDGAILVSAYIIYLIHLVKKEGRYSELKEELFLKDIWKDMVVIAICVAILITGANFFIKSSVNIANTLHIPHFVMGLVFLGFMTTFPELIIEIRAVMKGVSGIAFGDIMGSVVTNTTLILGVSALIKPITFPQIPFINAAFFMITAVFIALLFIKKKEITWQEGLGLLMLYLTFLVTEGLTGFK